MEANKKECSFLENFSVTNYAKHFGVSQTFMSLVLAGKRKLNVCRDKHRSIALFIFYINHSRRFHKLKIFKLKILVQK